MKKILIVNSNLGNYQTKRLKEEGKKKNVLVDNCGLNDLSVSFNKAGFEIFANGIEITTYNLVYFSSTYDKSIGKRRLNLVWIAKYLVNNTEVKVINSFLKNGIDSYLQLGNYMKQAMKKIDFPKSSVVFNRTNFLTELNKFEFPCIVKSGASSQGRLVFKVNNKSEALEAFDNLFSSGESIIIRDYIENDGDYRVFTVNYKTVGAMKRISGGKDFRNNISQGGRGEKVDEETLNKIAPIAEKLSRVLKIEVAGVDVMIDKNTSKPYILEINVGPQFGGLEKFIKVNVAGEIIDYFLELII